MKLVLCEESSLSNASLMVSKGSCSLLYCPAVVSIGLNPSLLSLYCIAPPFHCPFFLFLRLQPPLEYASLWVLGYVWLLTFGAVCSILPSMNLGSLAAKQ